MKKELLIVALGLSAVAPGCDKSDNKSGTGPDIDKLLKDLAKKPVPTQLQPGAMCYEVAMPPDRYEYVCQACGSKTIHTQEGLMFIDNLIRQNRFCVDELKKLGWDVKLDESFMCTKCRKEGVKTFYLEVTYKGKTARNELKAHDLVKLMAFAQGKQVWLGDTGGENPLKPELPRIKELIGVKE